MRKAIVYCHDIEAGLLEEATPGRGYTFTYDKQYMMDKTHDPVSLTMPFREEPYQSDYLFPIFTNMLPEGANRKIVCRSWRLDEKDFFGLLLKIATYDTIGAITVKEVES
ncbi:HipA N-terminal domain-containing protein [Segatella copri]|uniref:HipA N-terminal domain-containing protein n=1 Tax=Segatella copri TaxID=165179 RepID=UPI003F947ABD